MVSTHKRPYRLKARAERQRRTRERIVAATVALHEEVGPARTTIAAIARRAGVQRLTVYNLFPEARDLFAACQQRFLFETPVPDLAARHVADPIAHLQTTLVRLYTWYGATRAMERHIHRDRHLIPALDALMAKTSDVKFSEVVHAHARAIARRPPSTRLKAIVGLAFAFWTWELLTSFGLNAAASAELMARAVRAARPSG
jgi:AcrR family transcriptional regulator